MNRWEMLAAGIALLAGSWERLRRLADWVGGLVVVTVVLNDHMHNAIIDHLFAGRARRVVRRRTIGIRWAWSRSSGKKTYVAYERNPMSGTTFWIGWRPVWYTRLAAPVLLDYAHSFSFLRWTIDGDAMLAEAAKATEHASRASIHYVCGEDDVIGHGKAGEIAGREVLYNNKSVHGTLNRNDVPLGMDPADIGRDPLPSGLVNMSLTAELREVAAQMRRWLGLEGWCASRGIPWRRGYLFAGAPGTGKTMFARSIAEDLDLPVYVFDLATLSNQELHRAWATMLGDAPCMAVIEDVDGVFHGRENVSGANRRADGSGGGLTFDALLNCVDGPARTNGVLLILTTNHPELVDPALADRKGRIDRVVTFGPLDLEGRTRLARRILRDEARALQVAVDSGPVPASAFVETCCRAALDGMYDGGGDDDGEGKDPQPYRGPAGLADA